MTRNDTGNLFILVCLIYGSAYASEPLTLTGPDHPIPKTFNIGDVDTFIYTLSNNVPNARFPLNLTGISNPIKRTTVSGDCGNYTTHGPSTCNIGISISTTESNAGSSIKQNLIVDYQGRVPLTQEITFNVSNFIKFPIPYAGTFYPIYNSGVGQWIPPDSSMPFDKVSAIFVAFAHTYPEGNGAVFAFETGQPDEPTRLAMLSTVARSVNHKIKILMSLGWGHNDWTYINNDYVNHANLFVPSVIQFIRTHNVDGVDIDDESIGYTSGSIPQANFNGVIFNLRAALNKAATEDNKTYYLTITPAGNNANTGGLNMTQVDAKNVNSFDLINIQSYYGQIWSHNFYNSLVSIGYPMNKIANGIETENCNPIFPPFTNLAGLFNWNMTSDSVCNNFEYTKKIAQDVGYP